MSPRDALSERLYRRTMAVLPPGFRERFAHEMLDLARGRLRDARARGRLAIMR